MINTRSDAPSATAPVTAPVAAWYGGTFDPPHRGHQAIVRQLATLPDVEQVVITPAYLNPFKRTTLAPPEQRLAWAHRVFDAPGVTIDPGEIDAGHSVYTIDTLERLKPRYAIRYIAVGADTLDRIREWRAFETLNRRYTWLVFDRGERSGGYEQLRAYRRLPLDVPVSSSVIRAHGTLDDVDPLIADDVKKLLTKGTP